MTQVDPIRLIDDQHVSAQLRADLHVAASHPPGYGVEAGLARLQQQLRAPPAGSSPPAAAGGWGIVGVVTSVGLGIALLGYNAGPPPLPASPPSAMQERVAAAPTPVPVQQNQAAVVAAPQPVLAPPPTQLPDEVADDAPPPEETQNRRRAAHKPEGKRSASRGKTDDNRYLREVRKLNRARTELAKNPQKALALAEAGRREFAGGALAQEWDGVAILALVKLGRKQEAQTRGQRFLQRYPDGTFARKVRDATGQ